MGLRTPQELLRNTKTTPAPRAKFTAGKGQQISTDFISTASKGIAAKNAEIKKQQEKRQKAKNDFMDATWGNKLDNIRVEHEGQLADQKGVSALENVTDIKKSYMDNINTAFEELPESVRNNPEARLRLQTAIAKNTGNFDKFAIGYTHGESRKVEDEAYKTRVANDMNTMVENSGDLNYLSTTGLDSLTKSLTTNAERTYGSDRNVVLQSGLTAGDMIDAEVEAGRSASIAKAVQMQVTSNNFGLAKQTVDTLWDDITEDDKIKIEKTINKGLSGKEDTQSLALANEAYELSGGNLVQAQKHILAGAGTNGSVARKAMGFINTRHAVMEKQKKADSENIVNSQYDRMIKTGTMDMLEVNKLPQNEKNKLYKALNESNGQPLVVSNKGILQEANLRIDQMTDEDFVKMNIQTTYQKDLSSSDIKLLEDRQKHSRMRIEKGFEAGQRWNTSTPDRITEIFAGQLKYKKGSNKYSRLRQMTNDRYRDIMMENPKITPSEIDKKLTRDVNSSIKDIVTKESFFGDTVGPGIPEDATSIGPDRSSLTPSEINSLQRGRANKGLPPLTDDQLSEFAKFRARP